MLYVNFCYDCEHHRPSQDDYSSDYCSYYKTLHGSMQGDARECKNKKVKFRAEDAHHAMTGE